MEQQDLEYWLAISKPMIRHFLRKFDLPENMFWFPSVDDLAQETVFRFWKYYWQNELPLEAGRKLICTVAKSRVANARKRFKKKCSTSSLSEQLESQLADDSEPPVCKYEILNAMHPRLSDVERLIFNYFVITDSSFKNREARRIVTSFLRIEPNYLSKCIERIRVKADRLSDISGLSGTNPYTCSIAKHDSFLRPLLSQLANDLLADTPKSSDESRSMSKCPSHSQSLSDLLSTLPSDVRADLKSRAALIEIRRDLITTIARIVDQRFYCEFYGGTFSSDGPPQPLYLNNAFDSSRFWSLINLRSMTFDSSIAMSALLGDVNTVQDNLGWGNMHVEVRATGDPGTTDMDKFLRIRVHPHRPLA